MEKDKFQISELSRFLNKLKNKDNHCEITDKDVNEYKLICVNSEESECIITKNLLVKTTNYLVGRIHNKLEFIKNLSESNKNLIILRIAKHLKKH